MFGKNGGKNIVSKLSDNLGNQEHGAAPSIAYLEFLFLFCILQYTILCKL